MVKYALFERFIAQKSNQGSNPLALAKMAVILLSFFATSLSLVSVAANEQNCRKLNCKVLPVGENLESEFRLKASEKGVRIVYLNLKIGNNSYNPLELQDEFLPDRWVWARSNNEPMLSLPFDFDILSLGLLNYQVGSITVPLRDEPSGCLAGLNSTCQNMVVARALLDNVTSESGNTGVVCVAMMDIYATNQDVKECPINYHCCSSNVSSIHCDLSTVGNKWLQAIKISLYCLSSVVALFCPAFILLLPDCIFNLQNECDKEDRTENPLPNGAQPGSDGFDMRHGYQRIQNEEEKRLSRNTDEIPVDDASPVTCSMFVLGCVHLLPDLKSSFNVKLAVVMFCIFPFSFYFAPAIFFVLKPKYIHERLIKQPINTDFSAINLGFISPTSILGFSFLVLPCWTAVLFLKPKDLFLNNCPICECGQFDRVISYSVSIGDETLQHLKLFPEKTKSSMLALLYLHNRSLRKVVGVSTCYLKMTYRGSRGRRALISLWLLFSCLFTLFLGLVLAAVCLFLLLVSVLCLLIWFSPVVTLMVSMGQKIYTMIERVTNSISRILFIVLWGFFFLFTQYLVMVVFILFYGVFTSCTFFVGILGFTTMGLVLNVEIVTPYVSFLVVVITNVYLCYANLQRNYMEVKEFILKYRQQEFDSTSDADQSTIPTNLFWSVSDEVLPVTTEICLMLRDIAVILTFLFLTISSIIFFRNEYEISTLVSTIAVFISGAIPSLFLKGLTRGKNFSGWRRVLLERKIKAAVRKYAREGSRVGINRETVERSSFQNDSYIVV